MICVQTGRQSQQWLLSQISEVSSDSPVEDVVDQLLTNSLNRSPRNLLPPSCTYFDSQSRIVKTIASDAFHRRLSRISITEFPHNWGQNSIVARINGTSEHDVVVILGAHQDRLIILSSYLASAVISR